jgi:hypothetical protein
MTFEEALEYFKKNVFLRMGDSNNDSQIAEWFYLAATERAAGIAEETGKSYDGLKWPMSIVREKCKEIAQKIRE